MRIWGAAAIVAAALVPAPAAASCAAPFIEVEPNVVAPGDDVRVLGQFFADGCDDTGGGSVCSLVPDGFEPSPPMAGVQLQLVRDDAVIEEVVVDANADFEVEAVLTVPAGAAPGRYAVDALFGGFRQDRAAFRVDGGGGGD